jgi:2-oxoglutarate dehydrogenase E2 component (dihydrolipoamide succinyltransferase)
MSVDIEVPSLGESVTEATIAEWLKSEGDYVAMDEAIAEVETDKVTLEINAPAAGVLEKISSQAGEDVEVGAIIGQIDDTADKPAGQESDTDQDSTDTDKETVSTQSPTPSSAENNKKSMGDDRLSPSVKKLVDEHNLTPSDIPSTGKDGRLTKGDVMAYIRSLDDTSASRPTQQPVDTGAQEERVRMTRLRQRIAERLKEAQDTAAMLTTFNEVDMSAVKKARAKYKQKFADKYGVKLGFMSFFVKAAVKALQEFPAVNAEIQGNEMVYKNYYNIGVAVSTDDGLVVPVIENCDAKSFADIEQTINDLGGRARSGQLSMDELTGGTFTITNGGIFGSMLSTPILNPPQSGILGMHNIVDRPVVVDGEIVIRPIMYLALTYDHRIIDGREAVSFLYRVKQFIEDPERLLFEI